MIVPGAVILALVLGDPPVVPPPDAPAAQPTAALSPELAELDRRIGAIRDLRADFEQRKHTALLKKPLVSRGTVTALPQRVRWDTQTPRRSTLVAGRDEIRIHYPDERVVEVYPLAGDLRQLAGSPLPSLKALVEHFDIRTIDASRLPGDPPVSRPIAVEMVPRAAEIKEAVSIVTVLFDGAVPCVTRVVMTDPDGERTEIAFREVRTNTGVGDSDLELHVPAGTREVHPIGAGPPEKKR